MQLVNKSNLFILIIFGILAGFGTLILIPIAEKSILFLFAVPFAGLFFLMMVLRSKETLVLLLFVRSSLDIFLEKTKVGVSTSSAGVGGILNLLIIGLAIILIYRNSGALVNIVLFVKWWIFFILFCVISMAYAPDRAAAFKFVLQQVSTILIFLIPFFIVTNDQDKKFWLKVLLFSSLLPIGLANIGLLTGYRLFYLSSIDAGLRLRGPFTHANLMSFYAVLVIVIVFFIIKSKLFLLSPLKKNMLRLYLLNLAVILIATKGRTAWISCGLFFLLYGVLKEKKYLVMILLLGSLFILTPQGQERINTLSEKNATRDELNKNSFYWRTKIWRQTLPMIEESPLYGYGAGSFKVLSPTFAAVRKSGVYAHNVYLEILFETGVIGLLFYLAFFMMLLKLYFLKTLRGRGNLSVEGAILFSYLVGHLTVCFADNMAIYVSFNWYLYFFLGLATRSLFFSEKSEVMRSQ